MKCLKNLQAGEEAYILRGMKVILIKHYDEVSDPGKSNISIVKHKDKHFEVASDTECFDTEKEAVDYRIEQDRIKFGSPLEEKSVKEEKVEKEVKVKKSKEEKEKPKEKKEKQVTRGFIIRKGLEEQKSREEIIEIVSQAFPETDIKKIKTQYYVTLNNWKKEKGE